MKRTALALGAALVVAACGRTTTPPDDVLTVAMPPGRIADFERVLAPAFEEANGVRIEAIGLRSADQVARLRIEADAPTIDVLWIDLGEAQLLAREGHIASLSEDEVPRISEVRDEAKSELGIAPIAFSSALGFLYNTERLPEPPRSWRELWDPRFRGEIALFDFGSTLGPALLVMAARLHGGGEDAVEPGFEKLAELAEHAVAIQTSGPANNLLVAQGEAGLTFGLSSQMLDLRAGGAPVDWMVPEEGALALPQGFQVTKGSARPGLARAFIDYALGVDAQMRLAEELLLVVTNENVLLDPDTAELVPLGNVVYLDFAKIGARRGEWTNRFNREILTR